MRLHEQAQKEVADICSKMNLPVQTEYKLNDWRADVFTIVNGKKFVFEIQISPQSFVRTKERQSKYIRDGITACWLFEKFPKMEKETESIPIFLLSNEDNGISVSLKNRKKLSLSVFIRDFLTGKIKFCHTLNPIPRIKVKFIEFECWKCGSLNHIYFLAPFHSSCGSEIFQNEAMWSSEKFSFNPKIISRIQTYTKTEKGSKLKLATIKERYSQTVGDSYLSFGCRKCDSIFGDWFIQEAILDTWYEEEGIFDEFSFDVDFDLNLRQNIPHWCHSEKKFFCE